MKRKWPIYVPLIPGERLSSWLRRAGAIYGMTADELLDIGLGFAGLKASQIDLRVPEELATALFERTGISKESIERATFHGALSFLFCKSQIVSDDKEQCSVLWEKSKGRLPELSEWFPWFRNQFYGCRLCLRDYPFSPTMLSWGLNIIQSCGEHGLLLEPARLTNKTIHWLGSGAELVPKIVAVLDKRSNEAVNTGFVRLPGGVVSMEQWFILVQTIFQEMNDIQPLSSQRFLWQEMVWEVVGYCPRPGRPQRFSMSCATLIALAMSEIEENAIFPQGQLAFLFSAGSRQRTSTPAGTVAAMQEGKHTLAPA